MFRLTIKQLAAKKLRLLTTATAVLLGVAFLAGTLVLTDTIGRTLDSVLADANAGTDAYVRGTSELEVGFGEARPRIDASVADQVRRADGAHDVAVRISGYAQLVDKTGTPIGDPEAAPMFGFNWVTVDDLNPYRIATGHAPGNDDEIVIDKHSADAAGYRPGDRATVLTKSAPREFTISGIAKFGTADSPGGASAVLFTDAVAQHLLGETGKVDGIAVTAASGTSQAQLVASIEQFVGSDVQVITGAALTAEDQRAVADSFEFFNMFMLIFAAVAVFVGAFIINNTFSITVAQRTREMALLRAIGANRRQVLRSVLAEAVVVAILASTAGLAIGIGVAFGLEAMLASFGFDVPDGPTVVSGRTIVVSLTVGVLVTLASAFLPARRAARVAPIAALRETALDSSGGSKRRAAAGLAVTTAGVAALLAGLGGDEVSLVGLGAFTVFIGVSILGPVLARPVTRLLGSPLPRLRGVSGALARQNAMRNPKRTARTAASLMIGVGLVGFITIFAASVKTSVSSSLGRDYLGTHIVESGAYDSTAGVSPDLAASLRGRKGVEVVTASRVTRAAVDGMGRTDFYAFDAATVGQVTDLGTVQGDVRTLGADGIAVFAEEAAAKGWKLGDSVPVTFVTGTKPFLVRAIFDNSEEWLGKEFVGLAAFEANLPTQLDFRIYVSASDANALHDAAAAYPSVEVLDKKGFIDAINADIDKMLGLIYAMLALAIVIALLGIANTLALSIFERTRELGLLRAVGMAKAQLRATARWEAVLIALFGTSLGLGVGTFFGWAMVRAMSDQGITELSIPTGSLIVVTVVAAAAGVGAAIMPARRAARLNVLKAIASN
ncbi:MAG TPA: FtsX-like permease family protein [Acidimicrobiales bacterium]|nr:FtsX-like permease family protein [Acidimicrobiales bacterium]